MEKKNRKIQMKEETKKKQNSTRTKCLQEKSMYPHPPRFPPTACTVIHFHLYLKLANLSKENKLN